MIIGFIAEELAKLTLFKVIVKEFPLHGYVFYCDTRYLTSTKEDADSFKNNTLTEAVAFLLNKACDVMVVPNSDTAKKLANISGVSAVVEFSDLHQFLLHTDMHESKDATERIIHLTQHTEATDKEVASLLGGHFISE
jgi:hypothetical protein